MAGRLTLTIGNHDYLPSLDFAVDSDGLLNVRITVDGEPMIWGVGEMDIYSLRVFCDEAIRRIESKRKN